MKFRILPLLLISLAPLTLTQCVIRESDLMPSYGGPHQSTYESGVQMGRSDGRTGLSRNPYRHSGSFPSAEASAFTSGYEVGYNDGIKVSGGASYGQPLSSVNGQGTVVIKEGERTVAVCQTASPNIEQTRFINEQNQIVVKSRGNHGPATVQLFDSRSGSLVGSVKAYELANGGPSWAAGMAD